MDNSVNSVDNPEELANFIEESEILSIAKSEIRGWEHIVTEDFATNSPENGKTVPVLGLKWNLVTDSLKVDLRDFAEDDTPVTKRNILSAVHKIFDLLALPPLLRWEQKSFPKSDEN